MSDRELNDTYGLITDLRAKIAMLEAEAAGRVLMDAEGDAFLPEVVTQLRAELQEAVDIIKGIRSWIPEEDWPTPVLKGTDTFLAKHT